MSRIPAPDRDELRARYPDIFDRPASARLATPAMLLLALAIFIFGLVDLDFSPVRFVRGLRELGWITLLMLPPDPGSSLPLYLKALGETLSIALLGTTLAAIAALTVSLFAARNIVPEILRSKVAVFVELSRSAQRQRRQAEILAKAELKFRSLLEAAPDAMLITTAEGEIVFDGSIGDIGKLAEPVRLTVKNGMAQVTSDNEPAKRLKQQLNAKGREAYNIAEVGIGTNHQAQIDGETLEDEKVLGTVHIALGNNSGMGGKVSVPIHLDGLIRSPLSMSMTEFCWKMGF